MSYVEVILNENVLFLALLLVSLVIDCLSMNYFCCAFLCFARNKSEDTSIHFA